MPHIEIVDRGNGPQLSTCRITVQDLFPYVQQGCTHSEIRLVMPILSAEEISLVEAYIQENLVELAEQDRRIRERRAEQIREQSLQFPIPEGTTEQRFARLKSLLQARSHGATRNSPLKTME